MEFRFHNLKELEDFMQFLNRDKDSIIKEEAKQLTDASKDLQKSIDNSKVGEKK